MARFGRSRPRRLTPLLDVPSDRGGVDAFGGAAVGLAAAARGGVKVLDTWVLPTSAFREAVRTALPPGHDPASLLRIIDRPVGVARTAYARDTLLRANLARPLAAELGAFWTQVGAEAPWGLMISASPTLDDDALATWAGFDVVVVRGVRSEVGLLHAVRFVWASVLAEDVLLTLRRHRARNIGVAVVLQLLPVAAASGTLLVQSTGTGPDPQSRPDPRRAARRSSVPVPAHGLLHSTLGLGAPVVDGTSARDVARLTADGRLLDEWTAHKLLSLVGGRTGAVFTDTDADDATQFSVSPRAARGLGEVQRRVTEVTSSPTVVDFVATPAGAVHATAVRRVEGSGYPAGGGPDTVWARVGIEDDIPGPLTPLTRSLLHGFAESGARRVLADAGCRVPRGARITASAQGRVYLDLSVLVPALAHLPGTTPRELSVGLGGRAEETLRAQLAQSRATRSLLAVPVASARLVVWQRSLSGRVRRFERASDKQRRWHRQMDLAILPDDSLLGTLRDLRERIEAGTALLLESSLATLSAYVSLRTALKRSMPMSAARVARMVVSGIGSLASAEPALALAPVIAIAQKDPSAREPLLSGALETLSDLPHGPTRRAVGQYLEAFGDRGPREIDLGVPRWGEEPRNLLALVAAGLRHQPSDPEAALSYVRVQADAALADIEGRLQLVEAALVRSLAAQARKLLELRERSRVWLARTVSMYRRTVLDAGRRLSRLEAGLLPEAALFVGHGELEAALENRPHSLAAIARLRRAAYDRNAGRVDPPRAFVGRPSPVCLPVSDGTLWRGHGCCAGVVVGPARLVDAGGIGVERVGPGDIVVLRSFDAGLAPLVLLAAGIVSELGGPLSTGSVLAREFGVPMAAGVSTAMTGLRDGEPIRLDGDRGTVERVGS